MKLLNGPTWKKIWDKQRHFLHHVDEKSNKSLYCGKEGKAWGVGLLFCLVFYTCLALFSVLCFFLFRVAVLEPAGQVPYRLAHQYANEKITKASAGKQHRQLVRLKGMVDKALSQGSMSSPLDFPFLSTVPKRYRDDDDDPGTKRNDNYHAQMVKYYNRLVNIQNDEKWKRYKDADCDEAKYAKQMMGKDFFGKKACLSDITIIQDCNQAPNASYGFKITDPGGSYAPCQVLKMNKIVGFIPLPFSDKELKREVAKMKKESPKSVIVPKAAKNQPGKLPVVCTVSGPKGKAMKNFTLSFTPDPYFRLNKFPYLGEEGNTGAFLVLRQLYAAPVKDYNNQVIHTRCRVMAKNIPWNYKVDILKTSRYGQASFATKIYHDKNANEYFWKLEKDTRIY